MGKLASFMGGPLPAERVRPETPSEMLDLTPLPYRAREPTQRAPQASQNQNQSENSGVGIGGSAAPPEQVRELVANLPEVREMQEAVSAMANLNASLASRRPNGTAIVSATPTPGG